jgi:Tfp pilus assembly protein PilV
MKLHSRGMSLIEMAVAGVLLAALAALCLKFFVVAAEQRRAMAQRQTALCEASNLMERLAARPWDELSPDKLAQEKLSPEAAAMLPKAELKIDVAETTDAPRGKRITLRLSWPGVDPATPLAVQLTCWRYPRSPIPNP